LKELQHTYGVQIRWRSYELRPKGSPPIPPEYKARIEQARPVFASSMLAEYGVTISVGPFGINSRPALVAAKLAEAMGKSEVYHDATHHAYWVEGRDISNHEVLLELMKQIGLEPNQLEAALSDPRYEAEVDEDIAEAREFGLEGVPAMVFNNKYLVTGAQPYAMLARAVEQIQAETAS
jgi:predicted DsbA family dithiol-disulfide isomerase